MASWNELLGQIDALPNDPARAAWLQTQQQLALNKIAQRRGNTNVIFYASAFLQKPLVPPTNIQLTAEEINGFMSVMYGMKWDQGLTLVIHTPGGITSAAETIVSYLSSKFQRFEVIVPTFAMSAGTMICLAADKIVMGRQSQIGPIDPQMPFGGRLVSARAIVDQFDRAKSEILGNVTLAHVWAPILQSLGPAALQEAQNALAYGQRMVETWLASRMLKNAPDRSALAARIAQYFSDAGVHKSHGRRIDREEARAQGVAIEDLEDDTELQDAVLTAYHLVTIGFEKSPATKLLASNHGRLWLKNFQVTAINVPS